MRTKLIISFVLLIALIVTPLVGCTGNRSPIADFSYTPAAPSTDDAVIFSDSSTDSDGSIMNWAWDFGDGNSSSAQNPTHTFAAAGTYVVTLTVTDDGDASDTDSANVTVAAPPPLLDKWDAIEILVKEIIPPAASEDRISAFMLSEPLVAGDTVTSESGASYDITTKTWFIFIDDNPQAFYAHATRYVIMDARDGSYTVHSDSWPPEINGYSMWDSQLGRGHLIKLWSVLDIPVPLTPVTSDAPDADYGDAPDGQDAYYGIPGHFPTLFHTTNSHFGLPGGHTLNVGEEMLGLRVSAEVDALDPHDPDGRPNLVDADKDERIYVIIEQTQARLAFTVSVSLGAPNMTRYANALIDFDYSGNWSQSSFGVEWVTVNLEVDVDPGDSETILTPLFSWANPTPPTAGVWMRLALTRAEVDESLFTSVGGWDGSGQYAYGEIEDHFVCLTAMPPLPENVIHWPPPPPNGNGNGNGGGGEPPGPTKGPCGYDINYLVLVINCGDKYSHIAQGTPIAQEASSSMAAVAQEQGYTSAGNLGPGSNSLSEIGQAIADLAAQAKCGDHVLIYICGHGGEKSSSHPEGGICIYNSSGGRTGERLTPSDLADMLSAFDSCKDADCGTPGCCHVSVIIESCYAGNFNIPGLNDNENIVVSGSSSDTPAQGCMPGGGVYTAGFVNDSRDPDADQDDPPDGVDPLEAHASAEDAVESNNNRMGKGQQPWSEGDWCDCKCPCQPGIDVEKWVWFEEVGWVKEMEAELGQAIVFVIEIENDGECRDIIDLEIVDVLDDCLDYAGDAVLYYNGMPVGYMPPTDISAAAGGTQLTWDLSDVIEALSPGDTLSIEYYAEAIEPGPNLNTVFGSAHCSYNYDNIVTDQDYVAVWVGGEIEPEDVLYGELYVETYCQCEGPFCVFCDITASFAVTDLTQGDYPITNVALYLNGDKVFDSGTINTTYYTNSFPLPGAACGMTYNFQLVATNSIGLQVMPTQPVTTPTECQ
jgi:PKD repeat protein